MSLFLKKSNTKNGVYYQVYNGHYDPSTRNARQSPVAVIGYHDELLKQGIADPLQYAKDFVDALKEEEEAKNEATIDDDTPLKNFGCFLIDAFLRKLNFAKELELFNYGRKVQYSLYELVRFLTIAQIISPSSKLDEYRSFTADLPFATSFSYDQILDALETIGEDYPSLISFINDKYAKIKKRKTGNVYFDCTNYYFEIDRCFEDKQKGPSKENRTDPIIGMALLLDEEQLPLAMRMYPGNESEKPKIRELINEMKEDDSIKGKTIQIADKGLNCGQNIFEAVKNNDGYIYSQSVKMLPGIEKEWILYDKDYKETQENGETVFKIKCRVDTFPYAFEYEGRKLTHGFKQKRVIYWSKALADKQKAEIRALVDKAYYLSKSNAKKKEYGDSSKYLKLGVVNEDGVINTDNVEAFLNREKIEEDLSLCGYNMLITSELDMKAEEIYKAYKNLWRIEETFRIMKSDLQLRPVFLQKKERIYGHFTIGYLAALAIRHLELNTFEDEIPAHQIIKFMRNFKGIMTPEGFVNCSKRCDINMELVKKLNLPVNKKYLSKKRLRKILNYNL